MTGLKLKLSEHISRGDWLNFHQFGNSKLSASLIAAIVWNIWKVRCDIIFNHKIPNYHQIAKCAVEHTKEFMIDADCCKMLTYYP